jgi:hypothetical protein
MKIPTSQVGISFWLEFFPISGYFGSMIQESKKVKKEFTVKDFIKENAQLLSALAIFAALTEFSNHLSPAWFSYFIAILFFTCMVIILVELWKNASMMKSNDFFLTIFKYILFLIIILIVIYWMSRFRLLKIDIGSPVIFTLFFQIFLWVADKFKIFKLVAKEKKTKRIISFVVILGTLGFISAWLTIKFTPAVNIFLEQIK